VKTGGGGGHRIYRLPPGVEATNKNHKWPGTDIKTGNGYIVAPPSLHKSGNRYQIIDDIPPVEVPAWLLELVRKRPEPIALPAKAFSGQSSRYGLAALDGECANPFRLRGRFARKGLQHPRSAPR
jgi:Bifunctional DNA primase/polymerase, N-terminal